MSCQNAKQQGHWLKLSGVYQTPLDVREAIRRGAPAFISKLSEGHSVVLEVRDKKGQLVAKPKEGMDFILIGGNREVR